MPTTAEFKSKLYAHADRATRSRRAFPAPEATPRRDEAAAEPDPRDDVNAPPALPPAMRTLSGLPDRGTLLNPRAVVMIIFPGTKTRELASKMKWVRENLPFKVPLAHKTVCWFEADVRWWLEDRRNGKLASAPQRRRAGQATKVPATKRAAYAQPRRGARGKSGARRAKKRRAAR